MWFRSGKELLNLLINKISERERPLLLHRVVKYLLEDSV